MNMSLKANIQDHTFFNLMVFTSKSVEWDWNYSVFYMWSHPFFKGPKVIGQLEAQLLHGALFPHYLIYR